MNLTQILLITVIVGLIVYDVFAGKLGQPTESSALRDWGRHFTTLPFTAGFLLSHWFVNTTHLWASGWMLALPILFILSLWDLFWNVEKKDLSPWYRYPGLWAGVGAVCGYLMWAQGP